MSNSYKTAITRKNLPAPTRYLMTESALMGEVLDYGCGKCAIINSLLFENPTVCSVTSYDPYHNPINYKSKNYHTIICNYVLNTVRKDQELPILKDIQDSLKQSGKAYISVRRDLKPDHDATNKRGTYQRYVRLPLRLKKETSDFAMYVLTKHDDLCSLYQ